MKDGHVQEAHSGQQAGCQVAFFLFFVFSILFIHLFLCFLLVLDVLYLALTCRVFIYLLIFFIKLCGEISQLGEFFYEIKKVKIVILRDFFFCHFSK